MATFVRTQTIEHPIGARGRLSIGVTEADVGLTAIDGEVARIRATFELRAADDAEADAMFEAAQLHVTRGSTSLQVEQPNDHPSLRGAVGRWRGCSPAAGHRSCASRLNCHATPSCAWPR